MKARFPWMVAGNRRILRVDHLLAFTVLVAVTLACLALTIALAIHAGDGGSHVAALVAILVVDAGIAPLAAAGVRGVSSFQNPSVPAPLDAADVDHR